MKLKSKLEKEEIRLRNPELDNLLIELANEQLKAKRLTSQNQRRIKKLSSH